MLRTKIYKLIIDNTIDKKIEIEEPILSQQKKEKQPQ